MTLDEGERDEHPEVLARLNQAFTGLVPHNQALGLELVDFDRAGVAVMRLPWSEALVGNPETGVLHGGVITSLLDATAGAAVFVALWSPTPIATLDLRIDYLKPATPGRDVVARA
ncbi:hotdog fold thioesterase, partial [Myxococcota bacterium]|nr:hotdog fold thioesterase [Myxococcota bacterium]